MIVDDPRVQRAHGICMCLQARDPTFEQYERNPAVKVDNLERKKVWNKIARGGLVGVRPTPNGIDQIEGPEGELEASLAEINRYQSTAYRDIDEENDKGEAEDPALGGDPSNMDQGYHYNRQLTDEEHSIQLAIEETRLKAQPWYDSISRVVTTTDKDTKGNPITMPWYEWTCAQAWRKLRKLEPEETLRGEDECNRLYTLRSVLDVGLPDDEELEMMGLKSEDRLLMVESIWRMAPCFYQGPNLPQLRHFSFTRMFMSLVTDVPYRQKPLVFPYMQRSWYTPPFEP
jgi:hypothetical protein